LHWINHLRFHDLKVVKMPQGDGQNGWNRINAELKQFA
jgi:hypothetical protein